MRIAKFSDDTAEGVKKALLDFNQKGAKGVIVDVRYNPGGLLDRAVEVCDMFLPKGQVIVSIKGRNKGNNREYTSLADPICKQPLIVLGNYGSASASEIFAGAMKDTGRGVLIGPKGEHTYGKGSVQTISQINKSLEHDPNGDMRPSGIRLTTARYYTPSGKPILPDKGINFDIQVELPEGHELDLVRHGLLGDPDQMNPDLLPENLTQNKKEDEGGKKGLPGAAVHPQDNGKKMDSEDKPTTKTLEQILEEKSKPEAAAPAVKPALPAASPKEFHDLLLDEAVKYLKAHAILESRKAA
jgi:C-terminal processing protease CtpA/Prc